MVQDPVGTAERSTAKTTTNSGCLVAYHHHPHLAVAVLPALRHTSNLASARSIPHLHLARQ